MAERRAWLRGLLLVVGIALLLAFAPPAGASPPCECSLTGDVFPTATANLPTNVRFLVFGVEGRDLATLSLVPEGDLDHPVAVRLEAAGDAAGSRWLIPEAELTPGTAYILEAGGTNPLERRVEIGDFSDAVAPSLGAVTLTPQAMSGACAEHHAALVEASGLSDDLAPAGAVLLRLTVSDPEVDGLPRTVYLVPNAGLGGGMYVGYSDPDTDCLGNLPGTYGDHAYRARAVAFDWAGNSSLEVGPAEFEMVWIPGVGGCGCRATGSDAGSAALWVAAALAGLLLARRLRRPRPR
jgi:MYXO-CTERM domain-containing protein